uniref:Uncharacterized protein n=1 Tax=Panagrolaimus sp. ES5 TaxID=591445 RepID=A0AC34FSC7_9BILA
MNNADDPDPMFQEDELMEVQRLKERDEFINPASTNTAPGPSNVKRNARSGKRKNVQVGQDDELEEEEEDLPTTSKAKIAKKSSFPDWKPLLDDAKVSEVKQDAIEPFLYAISSKLSKEIVKEYFQDQTRNKCIVQKLGRKANQQFRNIQKAVRCPDDMYHPTGHYNYIKTCATADCVQVHHWDIALLHENVSRRRKNRNKSNKTVPEDETIELVQYLMNGIVEVIQDEVRERAAKVAQELLVVFELDSAKLIEKLSNDEFCNVISNSSKIQSCIKSHHNVNYLGTVHDHWLPETEEEIAADPIKKCPPGPSITINFSKDKKDKTTALQSLEPIMNNRERVVGKIQTWIEEEIIELTTVIEILKEPGFAVVKVLLEEEGII